MLRRQPTRSYHCFDPPIVCCSFVDSCS